MTAATRTMGPWRAVKNGLNYGVYDALGSNVAGVRGSSCPEVDSRCRADAALIAAAPDLLVALRDVLADLGPDCYTNAVRRAQAAIAKAEGRA